MNPKSINPYSTSDDKIKDALDFIINNLPASPTFEQLNEVLLTAVFGSDPDSPPNSDSLAPFIYSVLPLSYNGYVNTRTEDGGRRTEDNSRQPSSVLGHPSIITTQYTDNQLFIINNLLTGIKLLPLEAISDFLSNMDDTIAAGALTYQEQLPLYFAVRVARSHQTYWSEQISAPGGWALYLNANPAINYIHAPSWIAAGAEGVLLSYGIIKPAQAFFPDLFSSIIGGVGLPVGKVVFGWS